MKVFAHPVGQTTEPAHINEALRSTSVISTSEHKYVVDLKTELGELPRVQCFVSELNQVFLNIIVNAAHAIGDVMAATAERGTITGSTLVDGDEVVVTIADTGGGLPEAVRGRIFEPFFTTKELGKGTGQGLSIAHTIIDRHRGSLTFATAMGKGTVFCIRIPIAG